MKSEKAFVKLLKVACAKAEEAAARLAQLEAALAGAEEHLRILSDAVRSEETAARAAEVVGFTLLAGYFDGAAQKRATLLETKADVAAEIETTRRLLEDLFAEQKRLEHLLERAHSANARKRRRQETAEADATAIGRFQRTVDVG